MYNLLKGFSWRMILSFIKPLLSYVNDKHVLDKIYDVVENWKYLSLAKCINLIYGYPTIKNRCAHPLFVVVDEILKINEVNKMANIAPYYQILSAIGSYYDEYNPVIDNINENYQNTLLNLKDKNCRPAVFFVISSLYGSGLTNYQTNSKRNIHILPLPLLKIDNIISYIESTSWYKDNFLQSDNKDNYDVQTISKYHLYYLIYLTGGYPSQINILLNYYLDPSQSIIRTFDLKKINPDINEIIKDLTNEFCFFVIK